MTQPPLPLRFLAAGESRKTATAAKHCLEKMAAIARDVVFQQALSRIPNDLKAEARGALVATFLDTLPPDFAGTIVSEDLPEHLSWLDLISVRPWVGPNRHMISPSEAAWEFPLTATHIAEIIESDESNVPGYRASCDEVWLLIATNREMSGFVRLTEEARRASYRTDFDRVFFLHIPTGVVTELITEKN